MITQIHYGEQINLAVLPWSFWVAAMRGAGMSSVLACRLAARGWRKATVVAVRQWHSSEGRAGDVMGWDVCGMGGMAAPAASLPPNRGAMGVAALPAGLGR